MQHLQEHHQQEMERMVQHNHEQHARELEQRDMEHNRVHSAYEIELQALREPMNKGTPLVCKAPPTTVPVHLIPARAVDAEAGVALAAAASATEGAGETMFDM